MSTSMDGEIAEIAGKLGRTEESINASIDKIVEIIRPKYPAFTEDELRMRGFATLKTQLRRALASPAVSVEMIPVGMAEPWDIGNWNYTRALAQYEADPNAAIDAKVVDENGKPLDRFGRPQPEHQDIQTFVGAGKTVEGPLQPFATALTGDNCDPNLKLYHAYRGRFNIKGTDSEYAMNDSVHTNLMAADFELPDIVELFDTVLAPKQINLSELEDWHTKHCNKAGKLDPMAWFVVRCRVVDLPSEPVDRRDGRPGSYRMTVDDDTLAFITAEGATSSGVTTWIPQILEPYLGIGRGSEIFLVGATSVGEQWDRESGGTIPDTVEYNINALGLYPIVLISPEEAELFAKAAEVDV